MPLSHARLTTARAQLRLGFCTAAVASVFVLAARNVLAIDVGALLLCVVFISTGCIGISDAYKSVDGRVMLAVVFAFSLSDAMQTTNVAGLIASLIVDSFSPLGP